MKNYLILFVLLFFYLNSFSQNYLDDIKKVKEEFDFNDNEIFIEGCSALESLELLKMCDDFIISNSSFAWWGAYLSQNLHKTVIMPENWFVGLKTRDTFLIPGKNWIILD